MIILRVALDVPLSKLFDYRSEDATRADIGYRVLVPFGKKRLVGLIWDVATKSKVTDSRLRSVEKILRETGPLPREWLALVAFCCGLTPAAAHRQDRSHPFARLRPYSGRD